MPHPPDDAGVSRRAFLKGASAAAVAGSVTASMAAQPAARRLDERGPGLHEITLSINGKATAVRVETRTTLLDALRDRCDLTGAKKICDRGACGGCTVLFDGAPINSCLTLAMDAEGHEVTTIESLATGDRLHPLQESFVALDALQCGFCTPGMVMSAHACLNKRGQPTLAEIRADLSGNICRCGTYGRVFEAVQDAARKGGR